MGLLQNFIAWTIQLACLEVFCWCSFGWIRLYAVCARFSHVSLLRALPSLVPEWDAHVLCVAHRAPCSGACVSLSDSHFDALEHSANLGLRPRRVSASGSVPGVWSIWWTGTYGLPSVGHTVWLDASGLAVVSVRCSGSGPCSAGTGFDPAGLCSAAGSGPTGTSCYPCASGSGFGPVTGASVRWYRRLSRRKRLSRCKSLRRRIHHSRCKRHRSLCSPRFGRGRHRPRLRPRSCLAQLPVRPLLRVGVSYVAVLPLQRQGLM